MKLVLEIVPHHHDELISHRVIENFPVTIGRGYQSDIILHDPHISPQHLQIEKDEGGWLVKDLGSTNGIIVSGMEVRGTDLSLTSGAVIRIGQTELRFFAPHHAVQDAVPLQRSHPVLETLSRTFIVWLSFLAAVSCIELWVFLEMWSDETNMLLVGTAAGAIGTVILWATIWSIGGRLINHRSFFKEYVALMSLYLIADTALWYVTAYFTFLTNESLVAALIEYCLNGVLLGFLLYGSLSFASRMPQKRRMQVSGFGALAAVVLAISLSIVSVKGFNQQPLYPFQLEPYFSQMAMADEVGEFMEDSAQIFSDSEFAEVQDNIKKK